MGGSWPRFGADSQQIPEVTDAERAPGGFLGFTSCCGERSHPALPLPRPRAHPTPSPEPFFPPPISPCFTLPPPPQGKGVGGARKKLDAAILEDRDKPYACDSEYRTPLPGRPRRCRACSGPNRGRRTPQAGVSHPPAIPRPLPSWPKLVPSAPPSLLTLSNCDLEPAKTALPPPSAGGAVPTAAASSPPPPPPPFLSSSAPNHPQTPTSCWFFSPFFLSVRVPVRVSLRVSHVFLACFSRLSFCVSDSYKQKHSLKPPDRGSPLALCFFYLFSFLFSSLLKENNHPLTPAHPPMRVLFAGARGEGRGWPATPPWVRPKGTLAPLGQSFLCVYVCVPLSLKAPKLPPTGLSRRCWGGGWPRLPGRARGARLPHRHIPLAGCSALF